MNLLINVNQSLRVHTDHLDEKPETGPTKELLWWGRVPCNGCINELRCKFEHLACKAFQTFVWNGRATTPSEPSRAIYNKMFNGKDDDEDDE